MSFLDLWADLGSLAGTDETDSYDVVGFGHDTLKTSLYGFKRRVMDAVDGLPAVVRLTMLCYTARLLLYTEW